MVRFLEHRIGDERVIRLVRKWLKAGVLEDGEWSVSEKGTPQGAVASPLLANVYLHYVFDLWAQQWRRREATGNMIVVRYADDIVAGFEHEADARRFWDAMRTRFEQFGLELHGEKTRLLEFGRHAAARRQRRGLGKPETFTFLGFTFICGKSRRGAFQLQRKTRGDRMRATLREIKVQLRGPHARRHSRTGAMAEGGGHGVLRVPRGAHERYGRSARSDTTSPISGDARFGGAARRTHMTWATDDATCCVLAAATSHPSSMARPALCRQTPKVGAECSNWARSDLCGGCPVTGIPTVILGQFRDGREWLLGGRLARARHLLDPSRTLSDLRPGRPPKPLARKPARTPTLLRSPAPAHSKRLLAARSLPGPVALAATSAGLRRLRLSDQLALPCADALVDDAARGLDVEQHRLGGDLHHQRLAFDVLERTAPVVDSTGFIRRSQTQPLPRSWRRRRRKLRSVSGDYLSRGNA